MKFGENLYQLRRSAKLSQEQLAEKVGVSRQSISKWENSESYPEMDNIMKLCKIFHCKINNLVHDDIQDFDSLDEEIKMTKVKFEKDKQRRLKIISKIIYIIARILRIMTIVGITGLIIAMVAVTIFINSYSGNNTIFGFIQLNSEELFKVTELLTNYSPQVLTCIVIFVLSILIASLVLLSQTMKHLGDLFKNIYDGDTPFTLDNVHHIKSMSYLMISITLLSALGSAIASGLLKHEANFDLGFGLINILFLYSIAYIFEYGYQIQLDSNGRIYGDENE